jgi:hypothetical protein
MSPSALAALVLLWTFPVPPPAPPAAQAESEACSVSVRFGSYAMGIDSAAFDRVEHYATRNRRLVAGVRVTPWGREGERTVCIVTRSKSATSRVYADVTSLIRGRAERGPTEVSTADGRVWRSAPEMR